MVDFVGRQLGNYRLVKFLGTGGFADVYLGEHVYLTIQSAIKVLKTRLVDEEQERFLQEARIIARLIQPNIVRVLDYGVEGDVPFLVMDYAPNGTLRRRYPRGTRLTPQEITPYIQQVAAALQYAHAENVVHRDVKPENMLLGRNDEVLLSDFGIAVISETAHFQSTQEVIGTVAYMAPEQIQGKPVAASDQYALGIIAYEWLSGDVPFHGSFTEQCSQHLFATPPALEEKVPDIGSAIAAVVNRAIEKEPSKRFPDMQTFADAFTDAAQAEQPTVYAGVPTRHKTLANGATLSGEVEQTGEEPTVRAAKSDEMRAPDALPTVYPDTQASESKPALETEPVPVGKVPDLPEPPPEAPLEKHRISRRAVLVGAGIGLATLAVAGGVTWLIRSQETATSTTGTKPSSVFSPPPATRHVGTTLAIYRGHTAPVHSVSWSLSGQYIASAGEDTTVQVWSTTNAHTLYTYRGHAGLLDTVFTVVWSPNVTHIASGGADKTVQVWDASTGNHAYTYRGHLAPVLSLAWSPDGRYIASGGADRTVQVVDVAAQKYLYAYFGHAATVFAVAWSPDGTYVASAGRDKTVQIWEAATGKPVRTYKGHNNAVYSIAWSPDGTYIASGGADRTVQVWKAATGKQVYIYRGHTGLLNMVSTVAWSPDGNRIASGSTDETVQLWDATTGNNVYIYREHHAIVYTAQWSPDGKAIASGGVDEEVRIWQAS